MGTSKSYSGKGPQWPDLSRSVTYGCRPGTVQEKNLEKIVLNYVKNARGATSSGRGNSNIAGKAGIKAAKNLGSFLSGLVINNGNLSQTFKDSGIKDLTGKTVNDVINILIEHISGAASTIDDRAAKEAARVLLEEIAGNAKNIEELEQHFKNRLDRDSVEDVIIRYFGYYILDHLSVMFYEKLVKEKGEKDCSNLFRQIKDYIVTKLEDVNRDNPLSELDWQSSKADKLIKNIQENVLIIFEHHES